MKIGIIGGGISGLSCAWELMNNGVIPSVFEENDEIGGDINFSGMWIKNCIPHYEDALKHLKRKYKLELKPLQKITKLQMNFPHTRVEVKGDLGYIMNRGRQEFSLENMIYKNIQNPMIFGRKVQLDDIKKDFDYIVVASGDQVIPKDMGIWKNIYRAHCRITRVRGNFDENLVKVWFNRDYANHSFCYLAPKDRGEATITQIMDGGCLDERDSSWERFMKEVRMEGEEIDRKDILYDAGFVSPVRVDKFFFVGNAGGFTDDFIGMGTYNAIISGIWAARSILFNLDYNKIMAPFTNNILKFHEMRKVLNGFQNKEFESVGKLLKFPLVTWGFYQNPLFKMVHLYPFAKLYNHFISLKEN
jgi:digeranylgeranylglycerophospholipid reductase